MSVMSLVSKARSAGVVGVAVAAMAATAACGTSTAGSSTGAAVSTSSGSSTLTLALTQGTFTTFNPWAAGNGINGGLWNNGPLYDSLTHLSPGGTVLPGLATSWKVVGNKVTLQLRSGVTFSDGTPLNAQAVKVNMDYGASHPDGEECNPYIAGMKTTVTSPTSVTMVTPKPVPGLLQDLAQCAGFIVSPKALAHPNTLNSTPDGSGPYTLDQSATVLGQKYTYVRRAGYWDPAAYPFNKIVVTTFATATAADDAAHSGQVDYIEQVSPKDTASGLKILASRPDDFNGFFIVDTKGDIVKPLGIQAVRQAMNYALNRPVIASSLFGNQAAVSGSTPFPSIYKGYSPSLANYYSYNVAKAKRLLASAGYAKGFSVTALVDPGDQQLAEAIAGYESAIGIKLNIEIESGSFISDNLTGKYPLVMMNYTMNPAEEQTLEGIGGPAGFWNARHNDDHAVDTLLGQAINATSSSASQSTYSQLATVMAQHAWFINPVFLDTLSASNSKVLKVGITTGIQVPLLYNIGKAS